MTKSSIWKIIFILFLALISFSLITPFEDQNLGDYAISQASTTADASKYPEHESFSDIYTKLSDELDEGQQSTRSPRIWAASRCGSLTPS